jgi:probable addiction module antidote protein
MKTKLTKWDIINHLQTDEEITNYLDVVLDENDPHLLYAALGDIARAKGMMTISKETGLGRESLYKALSSTGNPSFATVQKILLAMGLKLHVSLL